MTGSTLFFILNKKELQKQLFFFITPLMSVFPQYQPHLLKSLLTKINILVDRAMKNYRLIYVLLIFIIVSSLCLTLVEAKEIKQIKLLISNPFSINRVDEPVIVSISKLKEIAPDFCPDSFIITTFDVGTPEAEEGKLKARILLSQADDLDGDGKTDEIVFLINVEPLQQKVVNISYGEIGVLKTTHEHHLKQLIQSVHTFELELTPPEIFSPLVQILMQKQGEWIGWESQLIGYRLYLDRRNAIDVFGKKKRGLELERFASAGFDYHRETEWGMDVLKVGESVGVGGFGFWRDDKLIKPAADQRAVRIIANGPARACFEIKYPEFIDGEEKYEVRSRITIYGGNRWAENEIFIEPVKKTDGRIFLATGIVKNEGVKVIQSKEEGLLATWGKQALQSNELPGGGYLGLAVILPPDELIKFTEDEFNHLAVLNTKDSKSRYRFVAAWEKELNGIADQQQFETCLREIALRMQKPLELKFITPVPLKEVPAPADTRGDKKAKTYQEAFRYLLDRIESTRQQLGEEFPTRGDNYTGVWQKTTNPFWPATFWVGLLWNAYNYTQNEEYRNFAELLCGKFQGRQANQNHDTGFANYYTFVLGYELTKNEKWKAEALAAANRLCELYNPKTGLIAAWWVGGDDSIIDTMMNLPILWWAYKQTGDVKYRDVATSHALTTRQYFVRKDGSTCQSIHFDPQTGEIKFKHTHQGYIHNSAWSRGQSWALYGYVIAYRETRDERFLQTAEHLAGYIATNLPEDYVPWYDYDDTGIIYKCKDSSAGAIAACGLLNFSEIHPKAELAESYRKLGLQIVNNLIDRYLTPVNPEENSPAGILRHSCVVRPSDCEIIWGTYYLSEALLWILKRGIER